MNDVPIRKSLVKECYKKNNKQSKNFIPESSSLRSYEENVEVMFGRDSNMLLMNTDHLNDFEAVSKTNSPSFTLRIAKCKPNFTQLKLKNNKKNVRSKST